MKTRTNSKAYMGKVEAYLLDAIDPEAYEQTGIETPAEKFSFAVDCFRSEYGHELKRGKSNQDVLADWFSGLPTACTIAFANWEILEIATEWGSLDENSTEKEKDKILMNWFSFMACKFIQIARTHGVSI